MKNIQTLKSKVINRNKFTGSVSVKEKYQKPSFSGCIKDLKDVFIEYSPEYDKNELHVPLEALLEHEITHKNNGKGKGCPKSKEDELENILIPISTALKSKGFKNIPFGNQGHTLYKCFVYFK